MNSWLGPAIIAAIISSIVTAFGWLVNYRTSLGIEKERRKEKVRDFQIALRAEIRSELHHLNEENLLADLKVIEGRYAKSKTYSVFVLGIAPHLVFKSLIGEIHLLPETVIDPLIIYMRQRQLIEQTAEEMRSERFLKATQQHQLEMYRDFIRLHVHLKSLAEDALKAIDEALNAK